MLLQKRHGHPDASHFLAAKRAIVNCRATAGGAALGQYGNFYGVLLAQAQGQLCAFFKACTHIAAIFDKYLGRARPNPLAIAGSNFGRCSGYAHTRIDLGANRDNASLGQPLLKNSVGDGFGFAVVSDPLTQQAGTNKHFVQLTAIDALLAWLSRLAVGLNTALNMAH